MPPLSKNIYRALKKGLKLQRKKNKRQEAFKLTDFTLTQEDKQQVQKLLKHKRLWFGSTINKKKKIWLQKTRMVVVQNANSQSTHTVKIQLQVLKESHAHSKFQKCHIQNGYHLPLARTKSKFEMMYWFPGIEKWIKDKYNNCILCQSRLQAIQSIKRANPSNP